MIKEMVEKEKASQARGGPTTIYMYGSSREELSRLAEMSDGASMSILIKMAVEMLYRSAISSPGTAAKAIADAQEK